MISLNKASVRRHLKEDPASNTAKLAGIAMLVMLMRLAFVDVEFGAALILSTELEAATLI